MTASGWLNLITDVPGLTVGHATDAAAQSGVTTVLCDGLWTAGVDVRGGGPGTRETEVLSLENLVGGVHAITLAGGSVFGLGAADGVVAALSARGVGLRLRPDGLAIPIVPSAVLYDLDAGGYKGWGLEPPYRALGVASVEGADRSFALGSVGAGAGARAGLEKGGVGSASVDLGDGVVVGALVAVNCVGTVRMADRVTFWAWPFEREGEFGGVRPVEFVQDHDPFGPTGRLRSPDASPGAPLSAKPGAHTTLAVVAASVALTPAECKRVAMMAHDGMARAIRPIHTPFDGDTVFALAPGGPETSSVQPSLASRPNLARAAVLARIGSAAADCLARAIARGVHEAGIGAPFATE
jgi:L-aminopeptidase/D-esterase-like protein